MNYIYIITILLMYLVIMLIHKTEKKQNIIVWFTISTMVIMCYNILICIICTFVGILCTLQNLSICNILMIGVLSTINLKNKKIQKYYFKVSDLVFLVLLLILVIFIAYKQYGFPFNIKYRTTDGSSHFFFAEQFYKNSTLLYREDSGNILGIPNLGFRLPGAYINEGILFKIFDGLVEKTDLFIIFDLAVLYISGILCYYLLKSYGKENKKTSVLAAIFSIIYILGYQLNSILYGYVYLSLALDIVITFLLVMKSRKKEEISDEIVLPILSILSFGIFFTYAYFIPIIYISIIVNIIGKNLSKKEKFEDNMMEIMLLIVSPLILGITYFVILPLTKGAKTEISTMIVDGEIYKNYITNLLAFIPIYIIGGTNYLKQNKKKQVDFSILLFILSIIFAIILFIGTQVNMVSEYYFFKVYYIIWLLAIVNVYIALINIIENTSKTLRRVTSIYIVIYFIAIIVATLMNTNIKINDIFNHNVEIIKNEKAILKREEIKILEKAKSYIEENQIYILPSQRPGRRKWTTTLHQNEELYIEQIFNDKITIEKWLEDKETKYYLAYYRDYKELASDNNYINEYSEGYEVLYNDEHGFILERK